MASSQLSVDLVRDIARFYYRDMYDEVVSELKRRIIIDGVMIGKTKVQYYVEHYDEINAGFVGEGSPSPTKCLVSIVDNTSWYDIPAWGARIIEKNGKFTGESMMVELYEGY